MFPITNVTLGTAPSFVAFSGTTSRLAVQHNMGGVGIGNIPYKVTFFYRRLRNPTGNVSIGIRKAAGDTFQLIALHPIMEPIQSGRRIAVNDLEPRFV